MFGVINRIRGYTRVKLVGDMPERFLNACCESQLEIISARRADELSMELLMPDAAVPRAEVVAAHSGFEIKLIKRGGGRRLGRSAVRRIFPAIMLMFIIGLLFWSKFYVWDIEVSGNGSVSAGRILDALSECGVECGAFWPAFSADNIRSELLYRIPELSWISVNMHGSLAEVIAVERREAPPLVLEGGSADIVADTEGFVRHVDALAGEAQVKAGAIVKKGDILISGAVESSYSPPRFLRAHGNIEAETDSSLTALLPAKQDRRSYTGAKKQKYALIIGNKRINFYSGSSISDAFCDKIISVWNIELPGLFSLPISIVRERSLVYENEGFKPDGYEAGKRLEIVLTETLVQRLGDGEVLGATLSFAETDGLMTATLRARCIENIGVIRELSEERKAEVEMKYTQKADDDTWQREE